MKTKHTLVKEPGAPVLEYPCAYLRTVPGSPIRYEVYIATDAREGVCVSSPSEPRIGMHFDGFDGMVWETHGQFERITQPFTVEYTP